MKIILFEVELDHNAQVQNTVTTCVGTNGELMMSINDLQRVQQQHSTDIIQISGESLVLLHDAASDDHGVELRTHFYNVNVIKISLYGTWVKIDWSCDVAHTHYARPLT